MGAKLTPRFHEELTAIATTLSDLSTELNKVVADMMKTDTPSLPLPWNQRHYDNLDVVTTGVWAIVTSSKPQLEAIKQNRPTHGEKVLERRVLDHQKALASEEPPKKKVGRPRKPKATPPQV